MARHRENKPSLLWVLPSLLIPLIVAAVAWADHVSGEGREIAPNVRFAGIDVSGVTPNDAASDVSRRSQEFLATPVTIDMGQQKVVMTAEEAGYQYDYDETVAEVVSARHRGGPWEEFVAWVSTPFESVTIPDNYVLNTDQARDRLAQKDFVLREPVEPALDNDADSGVYAVPGTDGIGIDIDGVIADLERADIQQGPVEIEATPKAIHPTVSDDEAEEVAAQVDSVTGTGFLAVVGDQSTKLTPGQIRKNIVSTVDNEKMSVTVDLEDFQAELESDFIEPIYPFVAPTFDVIDGTPIVLESGHPPAVCCSAASISTATQALLERPRAFYALKTRPDDDSKWNGWADGSDILEPVAEFTTYHRCCENRVVNIHTMADAMTGKYLIPGETLSMNQFIGPRTREKGYLPAGAIRSGYMTDEVGGGVSQFITTLFNAAFFGGLDLDEYQSHSVYFSRYPFGREATLSIPGPDLVMTNNTDYPVLIWPSYDDTSITVTFYSTKNVEVEELDQRVSRRSQCRHVATDRQRTFSDGRVVVDTIVANYRPGDGLDCSGNPIPKH